MNEKTLLIISIAISIMGLLILFLISTSEINKIKIKDIKNSHIGKKVKLSGKISKIINSKNLKIITLNDTTGEIKVISTYSKNLSKNDKIIVIGRVQEYEKELEINSEKLYIITLKLS